MMWASPNDVRYANDVCLRAHKGKHRIIAERSGAIHHYGEAITSLRQRRNITPNAPPQFPANALQSSRFYAIII